MVLEVLYSDVANLYGDLYNVTLLKETLQDQIQIVYTQFYQQPYFVDNHVDMIYMGSMMEKYQKVVIEQLQPYTAKIKELIQNGTIFLMTGNALEVFGKQIDEQSALHIFDFIVVSDYSSHHNSCYLGQFQDQYITGFKSCFSMIVDYDQPLFSTLKGYGYKNDRNKEGVCQNHFFGTYLIGPVLILNPAFTHYLLQLLGCDRPLANQQAIIEAYQYRLKEYLTYPDFKAFKH